MFGFMMPKGDKGPLSKMQMGGMGKAMIQGIMKSKNVMSLTELIDSARQNGVRMVACAMSMDLMGIKEEELLDGVETGGVAMYLDKAQQSNVNLFI
jgi:peroxiredoxin family protein